MKTIHLIAAKIELDEKNCSNQNSPKKSKMCPSSNPTLFNTRFFDLKKKQQHKNSINLSDFTAKIVNKILPF